LFFSRNVIKPDVSAGVWYWDGLLYACPKLIGLLLKTTLDPIPHGARVNMGVKPKYSPRFRIKSTVYDAESV